MCRGFQQNDRERLKIKAFYVNLSASSSHDSLTLHFLPSINGSSLEVNGSNIRPDSPAFITLHRVVSSGKISRGVIYGSREKVKGSEGLKFDIYMGDVKIMKGIFRKFEGQKWKLECTNEVEGDDVGVEKAEICVVVEDLGDGGEKVVSDKVDMKVRRRKGGKCIKLLEEIPEEREGENEFEWEGCCCCECRGDGGVDSEDEEIEDEEEGEMEEGVEGVRWAVDVGIWVVCLGVGYLVTKASSRRMRRKKEIDMMIWFR